MSSSLLPIRIGGLEIDFGMVIGNLVETTYAGSEIDVVWQQESFIPSEPIAKTIPDRWRLICDQAQQRGQTLTDGRLARLQHYSADNGRIVLTLQPTSYSVFVTTNLSLDLPIVPSDNTRLVSIREFAGSELFSYPSPYLANPLNVIGMIITSDRMTFTPRRSSSVYESPNTLQASVGGAVTFGEHPVQGLIREIKEEWGVDVEGMDIEFAGLGVNLATGEPDLIALVRPDMTYLQLKEVFEASAEKDEFRGFTPILLEVENLESMISSLRLEAWSQPSDKAAFVFALIQTFGVSAVENSMVGLL